MKTDFLKGLRHGIPIALGYLSVSFAFGITAVGCGLTPVQATLVSLLNVTSAGQLAGVQLMAAGSSLLQLALSQLTINLRYALMGLSLSQKLDAGMTTLKRMIFAFCDTDEIFAVASMQPGQVGFRYLLGLMTLPYLGWGLGTLLGALAGTLLPEFVIHALGIAIYGMFIAIVIPPSRASRAVRVVSLIAAGMSLCFRYLPFLRAVDSGYAIILCAVGASCIGAALFPVKEDD